MLGTVLGLGVELGTVLGTILELGVELGTVLTILGTTLGTILGGARHRTGCRARYCTGYYTGCLS